MSQDWIRIEGLLAHGVIGLHGHERSSPQEVRIDARLRLDLREIGRTDDVGCGVNYKSVSRALIAHAETSERHTIESLACDLAGICLHHDGVLEARIAVWKPNADPYAQRVVAEVTRFREELLERAYVVLGSNREPETNLPEAVHELAALGRVLCVSQAYEAPAVGAPGENDYVNAAVAIETCLPPGAIRRALKAIEQNAGRGEGSAGVTIDLDLCLYGELVVETGGVRVPRPEIVTRAFVARSLADLDPALAHPVTGESISDIAARLSAEQTLEVREDISIASCDPAQRTDAV